MRREQQQAQPMGMMQKLQGLLGIAEQAAQLEDRPRLMDMREAQANQQSQIDALQLQKLQADLAAAPEERAQRSRLAEAGVMDRLGMLAETTLDPVMKQRIMQLMGMNSGPAVDPIALARQQFEQQQPDIAAIQRKLSPQQQ